MATYDARPSGFTQLSTTSDWETFMSAAGIADGIDPASAGFVPSLDTGGRNAVISAGQCLIKGQLWRADAPVSTPIPAAAAQNRLDQLVLRLNRGATSSPTVVQPIVITGTPSGTPTLPPYTRTPGGIYDIPISYWTSASSGALTGLTDQRQYTGRMKQGEQFDFSGPIRVQSITAPSYGTQTKVWNITDNVVVGSAWRIRCWGHQVQGSTQQAFNMRGNATGAGGLGAIQWGVTNWPVGSDVHWFFECVMVITSLGSSGTYLSYSRMDQSMASGNLIGGSTTQMATAGVRVGGQGVNINTTVPLQMWVESSWGNVAGSPYSDCYASSFERCSFL